MDYLDTLYSNLHFIAYGLAILLAVFKYPMYFDTPLKFLPILLMYTLLNEVLGNIIHYYDEYSFIWSEFYLTYNVVIYNIYNIIFFLYFFFVFWSYIKLKKAKKIILIGGVIFIITAIINPFIQSFMFEAQFYTYAIGSLILIGCVLFYLKEVRSKFKTFFLSRDLVSWIGLGLVIFYVGYFPIKVFRYYNTLYNSIEGPSIRIIVISLVLCMYICFIIGFIRMRRRHDMKF